MLSAVRSLFRGRSAVAAAANDSGVEIRAAPRVAASGERVAKIGSKNYPLRNWSTVGFSAWPYDGDMIAEQRFKLTIAIRQDHFDIAFDAEAAVVRIDDDGIAGRFLSLPPDKKRQIEAYFAYYVRGGR